MPQQVSGTILKRQVIFWVAVLLTFIVFLYIFSSILLPFIAGMSVAYFLDPVADRLEKLGLSRLMATVVILVSFVLIFALALTIVIPIIINQFNDFARHVPGYFDQLQQVLNRAQGPAMPGWIR